MTFSSQNQLENPLFCQYFHTNPDDNWNFCWSPFFVWQMIWSIEGMGLISTMRNSTANCMAFKFFVTANYSMASLVQDSCSRNQ
jgi:hypothetical protein